MAELGVGGPQVSTDTRSGASVLGVYCGYIRALELRANAAHGDSASPVALPLAIMVSDDTEVGIKELLEANAYYGLTEAQVTLLKQEKVAARHRKATKRQVAFLYKDTRIFANDGLSTAEGKFSLKPISPAELSPGIWPGCGFNADRWPRGAPARMSPPPAA